MIYFIQAGKNGPIKIGYTDGDPYKRLNDLQTSNYEKLYLIAIMSGNLRVEQYIHHKFKYARIRGEWFYPTIRLMKFINSKEFVTLKKRRKIKHPHETKEERRIKTLALWDSGERHIGRITQTVYGSYGGNQRNQVVQWLEDNRGIRSM